jgi:hypothetical protein
LPGKQIILNPGKLPICGERDYRGECTAIRFREERQPRADQGIARVPPSSASPSTPSASASATSAPTATGLGSESSCSYARASPLAARRLDCASDCKDAQHRTRQRLEEPTSPLSLKDPVGFTWLADLTRIHTLGHDNAPMKDVSLLTLKMMDFVPPPPIATLWRVRREGGHSEGERAKKSNGGQVAKRDEHPARPDQECRIRYE